MVSRTLSLSIWQFHSLKIRGEHIDQYVSEHQDRARDAHAKSLQAAFAAWQEDLAADQSKFEADRILTLGLNSCNKTCGSMGWYWDDIYYTKYKS